MKTRTANTNVAGVFSEPSRLPLRVAIVALCLAVVALLAIGASKPQHASAAVDPTNCTDGITYDPTVPTFKDVADAATPPITPDQLGGFATGTTNRHITAQLYYYADALTAATANNPDVRIKSFDLGPTELGNFVGPRTDHGENGASFKIYVVGTPDHIAALDSDSAFWRGVRDGSISTDQGIAEAKNHTAMAWITGAPHGNEPAGGEASLRTLYELAARRDCGNMRRLANLDMFFEPVRNPDGRDANQRTTAWSFDPNRDLMTVNQDINRAPLDFIYDHPGLFFIDAHQQTSGYFFPPNEDPVLHEISHFSLDEIQDTIGPALQDRFNDQSLQYRNYNNYDLFTPEYGDTVPSLVLGAAGMTYEKGSNEVYGKQVYDHYLAMDQTITTVSNDVNDLKDGWIKQWQEASNQGSNCQLQANSLVSPLHTTIEQQPNIPICGYYMKPDSHSADNAAILQKLRARGVKVYKLTQETDVSGAKIFGTGKPTSAAPESTTLPAGTFWIPNSQTMKHWINSTMEEDPFIPYKYFYDVVNWSFPELYAQGGNGELESALPANTPMTEVTGDLDLGSAPSTDQPVYAFNADSLGAMGLITDLLDDGATVYRGKTAFTAGGHPFTTGAAMVDGSTITQAQITQLAKDRQTPVYGLSSYPVDRFAIQKPKVAIYTGSTTVPENPLNPNLASTVPGKCNSTSFCEALFGFTQQLGLSPSQVTPLTSTDIANGALTSQNYTALISANSALSATIPTGSTLSPATALQQFVNNGGNFAAYGVNGLTSIRNAGMSNVNTSATNVAPFTNGTCANTSTENGPGALTSPGTTFSASYDTSDPAAWGFDEGGYIYRDSSSSSTDPVFDPATLASTMPGVYPDATAAVSYPTNVTAYGYTCNTLDPGELPGRPYTVDQAFGAGHNVVVGSNAFFRDWNIGALRLILNGTLYPNGASIPAGPATRAANRGTAAAATKSESPTPVKSSKLPKVKNRPAITSHDTNTDVRVTVKRDQASLLRKIVIGSKLPSKVARKVRYVRSGNKVTLLIPGKYEPDPEERPLWAWNVINRMIHHHIKPSQRQI